MADFNSIAKQTFKFEGGFQNDPNDTANYNSRKELIGTNRGISAIAYENYLGRVVTVADIKAITEEIAKDVYKKKFWNPLQGDKIKNQSVAHIMFDAFIASGFLGLQRIRIALNKYYGKKVVPEIKSGISNSELDLINNANPQKLFNIIKEGEIANRKALAEANPSKYGKFLKGWLNRLDKITFTGAAVATGGFFLYWQLQRF